MLNVELNKAELREERSEVPIVSTRSTELVSIILVAGNYEFGPVIVRIENLTFTI